MSMNTSATVVVARPTLRFDIENAPEAAVSAGARRIALTTSGRRHGPITRLVSPSDIGELIKPFVFLDHAEVAPRPEPLFGIHPHSGIATLTVVLRGGVVYEDTTGKTGTVATGGLEWMKAGNGIIHDEVLNVDPQTTDLLTHAFQFWINLPSKQKAEPPEYLAVQASEVPQQMLPDKRGWIKVVIGEYENLASKIPNYSKQFLYHIYLEAEKQFLIETEIGLESAALLPAQDAVINDTEIHAGEFIEFDRNGGTIEIKGNSKNPVDIIVFGGEPYTEPIFAEGPFVMNSDKEIGEAYRDFYAGKYGEINYSQ